MMDIVERLREYETWSEDWPIIKEAADKIERLREALQKIADIEGGNVDVIWKEMRGIARAALKGKE